MVRAWLAVAARDIRLARRQGADSLLSVGFFVLAALLFPFGVGPDPAVLGRIGPGILWVAALLASLLSLERLFQNDYDDGTLELMSLGPLPLPAVVGAKVIAHWVTSALPLLLATPLLAILLHIDLKTLPILMLALALGTPTLSLIGAVGAALVLGARRGGVLLALLILPFYIPVLIFGVAAVDAVTLDLPVRPSLLMLGGLLLGSLVLGPPTTAVAVRIAVN